MAKRRWIGLWMAAGTMFLMQAGGPAHGDVVVTGPSQGTIPDDDRAPAFLLARGDTAADQHQGGGGGGTGNDGARGPSPEAGTGGTSGTGGSRPDEPDDRPVPGSAASPQGGGGGGGGQRPSNVVPVMPGNPDGIDAVPEPSPSQDPNQGGGGGGGMPMDYSPFIRVLPGGDAADWARSPSPSPR